MTDEQIINALKKYIECAEGTQIARDVGGTLVISLLQNALDLINRQQAEIERVERHTEMYHELRAEAIKEFAKKIDDEIYEALTNNENVIREREIKHNVNRYDDMFCASTMGKNTALCGIHDFIVTLVKEMVGEQE